MDIDALRLERQELEINLQKSIGALIGGFTAITGISPYAVNVHLIDITRIGEKEPSYVVGKITVDIKL